MDETDQRYAYRCLPLNMANQLGWDILCPFDFSAYWTGDKTQQGVIIKCPDGSPHLVHSHFGHGIITFSVPFLFQTPDGINLLAKGTPNCPKDGIYALEGVVEADWSHATFTMNYLFTRTNRLVRFEKDEPICRIVPIPRYLSEMLTPVVGEMVDNPALQEKYLAWCRSRDDFNRGLREGDPSVTSQKWQKDYFKGEGARVHQTKLHQGDFGAESTGDNDVRDTPEPDPTSTLQAAGLGAGGGGCPFAAAAAR
jgi:hypothetical protein